MKTRTIIQLFIPAAFCAFISAMILFTGESARPAFYAFLPMCFFFGAFPLVTMHRRIRVLEEKLKQANGGDSRRVE